MLKTIAILCLIWIAALLIAWLVVIPRLRRGPRGEAVTGLLWHIARMYCRVLHRARFEGHEALRDDQNPGSMVVISNHTGAADPILLQSACRFHIRWMMASSMMTSTFDWLWRLQEIIAVSRDGSDSGPLREAIRHVKSGRVVGIFPEGRIVTPPRRVWPFMRGAGLLVAKTKAPVLLVWISGTPETNQFGPGLSTPSHARLQFVELIDFGEERDPGVIADTLRRRIAECSDWPMEDEIAPAVVVSDDPFAARVATT